MPLVKKINEEWKPAEKPELEVGDIIEMTNPEKLVLLGMAVLCDAEGNELSRPGSFGCPICMFTSSEAHALAIHIMTKHPRKNAAGPVISEKTEEKKEIPQEKVPAYFSAAKETPVIHVHPESAEGITTVTTIPETEEKSKRTDDTVGTVGFFAETPTPKEALQKAFKDMTDEEKKAWRIENLRRAREKKKEV